jgi:ketosteroid isomerase-like protein
MVIMPETAHKKIKELGNKFFSVTFRRRRDKVERDPDTGEKKIVARAGDLREMSCQCGVKKYRKTPDGEGKKYVFSEHDLVSVTDTKIKQYRSFAWANILTLKASGQEYVVLSEQTKEYCLANPESEIAQKVKEAGIEF